MSELTPEEMSVMLAQMDVEFANHPPPKEDVEFVHGVCRRVAMSLARIGITESIEPFVIVTVLVVACGMDEWSDRITSVSDHHRDIVRAALDHVRSQRDVH